MLCCCLQGGNSQDHRLPAAVDALLALSQVACIAFLALYRVRGYRLPRNLSASYPIYNDAASAPARVLLPAKAGGFAPLQRDVQSSEELHANSEAVPLCKVADAGAPPQAEQLSANAPTWRLPDDESGLTAFYESLVRCSLASVTFA